MREIKFRVWDKTAQEMWSWNDALSTMVGGTGQDLFSRDDLEVMQYTSLKDKNGREMYEGDILAYDSIDYHKDTYQVRYEVRFGEYDNGEDYGDKVSGCGWWLKRFLLVRSNGEIDSEVEVYDYQGLHGLDKMKVIGNIYENPELLNCNATRENK